ncbi:MAG: hypothetical protein HOA90_13040, partial [Prolixibacteraceae bacterium]|nr:hypothetical protein [Prolixibacteraceae bacterium]
VTDAQQTVIENTSGINSGDQDISGIDDNAADIATKVDKNTNITGDTKTKITYDDKGLVTAGTDATTADISASTNKNYVTDAQKVVIENTSGANTGDQDLSSLALKSNVLELDNTTLFTPDADYEPATKAYVDVLLARIEALEETTDVLNNGFIDTRDGNHYDVVKIGNQIWMAENLKYLPSVVGPGTGSETSPYYYVYDYDGTVVAEAKATAHYSTYGVLYNWPATMNGAISSTANPSGVQGVCPTGWHLPSDAEWTELSDYLIANGYGYGGSGDDIAKSLATTSNWSASATPGSPGNDPASNNSSGFSALQGGYRGSTGSFSEVGDHGYWWSATEEEGSHAWTRHLHYRGSDVGRYYDFKEHGFSVRCIRD